MKRRFKQIMSLCLILIIALISFISAFATETTPNNETLPFVSYTSSPENSPYYQEYLSKDYINFVPFNKASANKLAEYTQYFSTDKRYIHPPSTIFHKNYDDSLPTVSISADGIYHVLDNYFLYFSSVDEKSDTLIYKSDKKIDYVCGNREIVFIVSDGIVYRLHIASKIIEKIYKTGDVDYFYPYTVNSFVWSNNQNSSRSEKESYLFYDLKSKTVSTAREEHFHIPDEEMQLHNALTRSSYIINGKSVPHSAYHVGSYFNNTGSPTGTNSPGVTGISPCTHHGNCNYNGSCGCTMFGGAIQCQGYANFIYRYIWPTLPAEAPSGGNVSYSDIPLGAWVQSDISGPNTHAWIIVSKSSSGFIIHEANRNGNCQVSSRYISYSSAQSTLGPLIKWHHKDAANYTSHIHEYVICTSNGSVSHTKSCLCGDKITEYHTKSHSATQECVSCH